MNIFRQLTEKPWLPVDHKVAGVYARRASSTPAVRVGLRMFLVVVGVLFFLLAVAFADRMALEDWYPTPPPGLMWLNTVMLILGGIAMQWAQNSARREQREGVQTGLFLGGALTFAFLIGQLFAIRQLIGQEYFEIRHPAIILFILIAALHGMHLLGGLVAWARTINKVWLGNYEVSQVRLSVELCTFYWHVLLVIWLVLFGLLFSGSNNLALLLTLCGIR